jgi:hypothetical protein
VCLLLQRVDSAVAEILVNPLADRMPIVRYG